jgi:transposase-like protein
MGRHIIFKCPRTGMNVQHWLDEVGLRKCQDAYKSVSCPACTAAHFIHRESGKLLGEE